MSALRSALRGVPGRERRHSCRLFGPFLSLYTAWFYVRVDDSWASLMLAGSPPVARSATPLVIILFKPKFLTSLK